MRDQQVADLGGVQHVGEAGQRPLLDPRPLVREQGLLLLLQDALCFQPLHAAARVMEDVHQDAHDHGVDGEEEDPQRPGPAGLGREEGLLELDDPCGAQESRGHEPRPEPSIGGTEDHRGEEQPKGDGVSQDRSRGQVETDRQRREERRHGVAGQRPRSGRGRGHQPVEKTCTPGAGHRSETAVSFAQHTRLVGRLGGPSRRFCAAPRHA